MAEFKRGTVLRDREGDLWRVSNKGNAYPINDAGHRQGSHNYMRIGYLVDRYGPLTTDAETAALSLSTR